MLNFHRFLLILINSLVVNFFLDYKIVLGSLGLSSMITIRNYFVKNNLEHKLIKITFFVVLVRILASYFMGAGLLFWVIGFGLGHMFFGSYLHFKYDKAS